jgi:3-methyladenine DNA glycosylase Mpg
MIYNNLYLYSLYGLYILLQICCEMYGLLRNVRFTIDLLQGVRFAANLLQSVWFAAIC